MLDSPPNRPADRRPWLLLSIWFALVSLGFASLGAYGVARGEVLATPGQWPADLPRPAGPTVLCFVHPRCPCSRATLAELNRLEDRLPGDLHLEYVLFQPKGAQGFWGDEPWRGLHRDGSTSNTRLRLDPGGELARRFGAATSGMILAYRADGELCFEGGITATRGHEGPSAAQDWLVAALAPESNLPVRPAPVFGCPILNPTDPSPVGCCEQDDSDPVGPDGAPEPRHD